MPSPFPGMDPYLEDDKLWPVFHNQLAHCMYQMVLPGLMDRYRARIAQRHYFTEQALFTSVVREEHLEQFIEIRQRADGRLVTLIDIVSPANKSTVLGRKLFLDKRQEVRTQHGGIVQIELVGPGTPILSYTSDGQVDWDYGVTVLRCNQPDRPELYPSTLQKRLPRFRLPLAADDRDTVVDLQAAFTRTYDQGDFAKQIDYAKEPSIQLSVEQKQWIDDRLREQKLRK